MPLKDTTATRFWGKVSKTPTCWLWTGAGAGGRGGSSHQDAYGRIRHQGQVVSVHRLSWEIHFGSIPAGALVCHHCDTPLCVRPDHLFLGTATDNIVDSIAKGRWGHRSRPRAKLNALIVRRLRSSYSLGVPIKRLARSLGVAPSTVRRAVMAQTWRDIS